MQRPGTALDPTCPATADAVDDYLRGEDLRRAEVDEVFGHNEYAIAGRGRRRQLSAIIGRVRSAGHGHHFVIRGIRGSGSSMAATHYFVLANMRGGVYVVDAYTREINSDVQGYVRRQEFVSYDLFGAFEASLASP